MSGAVEEPDNNAQATDKKRRRHRKKQLYSSILKQMEFYFSDAALSKDRFLAQLLEKDPFVPLEVFLRFNKIKALTIKTSDIVGALHESKLLEVSEDNLKVKRVTPMTPYDADARTVYVERIPVTADLGWLTSVFQSHGEIAYISLPKYFNTNRIKGFAFVEFVNEEDAKKCLEKFTLMGCKLPTNIKAETLASCQGFQPDLPEQPDPQDPSTPVEGDPEPPKEDRKQESEQELEPPPKKKRKRHSTDSAKSKEPKDLDVKKEETVEGDKENEVIEESATEQSESAAEQSAAEVECGEAGETEAASKKSKPVRKRKKKDRKKVHKEREKKSIEQTARNLQVLSKGEWKVLRNKYLTLQRKHMKALKQVLRTQHSLPENRAKGPTGMPTGYTEHRDAEEPMEQSSVPPEIPFVEGVIVAVRLDEPCVDVKALRRSCREHVHVAFVDVKEGQQDVHLRMDGPEAAKQYAASGIYPSARVLSGQEELAYWEVLRRQQGEKFSKRKVRGRDRLVKKATQLAAPGDPPLPQGKHIHFDD